MWFIWLIGIALLFLAVKGRQRQRFQQRQQVIERLTFDASVTRRVHNKYPHLTSSQLEQVLDGLRDYFKLYHLGQHRGMLSMPSQAVDEAWHAFILSTKAYATFCQRAFGKFLHHHPAETMRSRTEANKGIKRVWNLACRQEGINAAKPERLPRIFALDADLQIPEGFRYSLNCLAALSGAALASDSYCASHIGAGCGASGCGGSAGMDSSGSDHASSDTSSHHSGHHQGDHSGSSSHHDASCGGSNGGGDNNGCSGNSGCSGSSGCGGGGCGGGGGD